MRTENVAAFEKLLFCSSAIIGIYRIQREESSHAKTATVPSNLAYHRSIHSVLTGARIPIDLLTLDEYEVIRLVGSKPRAVCRSNGDFSTVQEIYESARSKIVACLVCGKPLHITGETTASAEDRRQLTALVAAGCRDKYGKSGKTCKGDSIMKLQLPMTTVRSFSISVTEQFKLYESVDGKSSMQSLIPTAAVTAHWQDS